MPLPPLRSDTVRAERDPHLSDIAARVLDHAADLCEMGWCVLSEARDQRGNRCMATSPEAVQWCATGAMRRAVRIIFGPLTTARACAVHAYVHAMMRHVTEYSDIRRWNDALPDRSQAKVVNGLRAGAAAIRAERAERGYA